LFGRSLDGCIGGGGGETSAEEVGNLSTEIEVLNEYRVAQVSSDDCDADLVKVFQKNIVMVSYFRHYLSSVSVFSL
jgi:hypothetical protein